MADAITLPQIPSLTPAQVAALVECVQAFGFMNPYLAMLNPMQQKALVDLVAAFGLTWLNPIIDVVNQLPVPTPAPHVPAKA